MGSRPGRLWLFALALTWAAGLHGEAHAQTKVRIALPALSVIFSPVYLASDAGYFKDAGVEVETSVIPGPAAMNAVIGGSADMTAIAGFIQVRAAERGQKSLAIANLQDKPTAEVVLSAAAAAKLGDPSKLAVPERVRALKGLTLAVDAANGLPHGVLRWLLASAGLDPERDVRVAFVAPTAMFAAMQKGEVDGMVFSAPFTLEAVKGGARMWISGPAGEMSGLEPTTYNVLVSRDGYCASAPGTCRAVVAALNRALQTIASEPDKALAIVGKRFDRMDPAILREAFDAYRKAAARKAAPMGRAYEMTVDTLMAGSAADKDRLKALVRTIQTDQYLGQ